MVVDLVVDEVVDVVLCVVVVEVVEARVLVMKRDEVEVNIEGCVPKPCWTIGVTSAVAVDDVVVDVDAKVSGSPQASAM